MSVTFNAGGAGNVGNTTSESGSKPDPARMSTREIVNELANGNPDAARKEALVNELLKRTENSREGAGSCGASGAGGHGAEIDILALLMKLLNGTISGEELEQLAKALGMDPRQLLAMNPALNAQADSRDIRGG